MMVLRVMPVNRDKSSPWMSRRQWLLSSGAVAFVAQMPGKPNAADPWSKAELIEPSDLLKLLNEANQQFHILCVTFPVLYRQKHIPHAQLAGPANKPAGIAMLRKAVEALPRDADLVIYCGCCPMKDCPNVRPAYRTLKDMGFQHLRVLDLQMNFHVDWVAKAYPVETL